MTGQNGWLSVHPFWPRYIAIASSFLLRIGNQSAPATQRVLQVGPLLCDGDQDQAAQIALVPTARFVENDGQGARTRLSELALHRSSEGLGHRHDGQRCLRSPGGSGSRIAWYARHHERSLRNSGSRRRGAPRGRCPRDVSPALAQVPASFTPATRWLRPLGRAGSSWLGIDREQSSQGQARQVLGDHRVLQRPVRRRALRVIRPFCLLCSEHDRAVVAPKGPGKIAATANLRFLLIFEARSAILRTVKSADSVPGPTVVR